ncbi:MAG: hypothetical protein CSA62_02065 [Planctomycetota bacterium]|nr:MAG: hypothetical protein CSA62_02065 [Planctomycetota bacterium]
MNTTPGTEVRRRSPTSTLLEAWLRIDFFGAGRREGKSGTGSLSSTVFTQGFLSYLFAALAWGEVPALRYDAGCLLFVMGLALMGTLGSLRGQLDDAAERDMLLASPISRTQLAVARGLHTALLQSAFTLGLGIAPAVLGVWVHGSLSAAPLFLFFAIWSAFGLTALFEIPIVLVDRLRGPGAASAFSALLRGVLLGSMFLGALLGLRAMHLGASSLPFLASFVPYMPSVPAAKAISELLAGSGSSSQLWLALSWPLAAILLLTVLARLPRRMHSTQRRRPRSRSWGLQLSGVSARGPADAGLARFLGLMLLRERSYRLRALPLLGLPVAVALLGLNAAQEAGRGQLFLALVHVLPLVYTPALLVFLPYAEHFRAAWLLEFSLDEPMAASRRAAVAVFGLIQLWVQAALFLLDFWQTEPLGAAMRSCAALGLGWLLLPLLLRPLEAPLFSQDPESFEPPEMLGSFIGFGLFVTIAAVGLAALAPVLQAVLSLGLLAAGFWVWRRGVRR